MSDLTIGRDPDGVLVVDSRLVAQELRIQHENFMDTIRKYQKQAEQAFGVLRFETGKPTAGSLGGRPEKYCLLTEEQATFYMTLSRNTPEVVELKVKLVKAFSDAKRLLLGLGVPQPQTTTVYIQRLQNMSDHIVADDVWTAFREGAEVLLMVETKFRVPVSQLDLCDGSIGNHWSQYRKEIDIHLVKDEEGKYIEDENGNYIETRKSYIHRHKDQRGDRPANAFEYSELSIFKKWLREVYIPIHLPEYLIVRYGKRAVLQIYEEQKQVNEYIMQITRIKRSAPEEEKKHEIFLAARDAMSPRLLIGG
jgi:phage regulator Rha-like protein